MKALEKELAGVGGRGDTVRGKPGGGRYLGPDLGGKDSSPCSQREGWMWLGGWVRCWQAHPWGWG